MLNKISELEKFIGNTKIIESLKIKERYNLKSNIYLKIESTNYSGSIKDRLVYYLIKDAIMKELINENTIIAEATSGNTGISIAAITNYIGIKCIIVMPENTSIEKIKILKQYNATVILSSSDQGMEGSINIVKNIKENNPNIFCLDQFNNPLGAYVHYKTTGPEIFKDLSDLDYFVCGVGTGTTFTGCSKYLKEHNPNIKCIAVEPLGSNVLNNGQAGNHLIEGIGAGFIPNILDINLIDEIIDVDNEEAYKYTKELYDIENLQCGISSGAALYAGIKLGKKYDNKKILIILPDNGNRYISKGVFTDEFI